MSEHSDQVALFQWAAHRLGVYPELDMMFAIPNGGHRVKAVAAKLKAEGVQRGVPDVFLAVSRGGYAGLFLELKHGRNKATKEQAAWIDRLTARGYRALVVKEYEGAKNAIIEYLTLEDKKP